MSSKAITNMAQLESLVEGLSTDLSLNNKTQIISLSGNELADISLKVSKEVRKELSIDSLLENVVNILGEAGIAERVLLFQIRPETSKALLTHYYESAYVTKFNPIGYTLDSVNAPMFKLFDLNKNRILQIEDLSKYLTLPNYLFKNKFKALFIKLKTKSLVIATGSTDKVTVALNLQYSTRSVIWSNEVEKLLQSLIDQLAIAIEQNDEKRNKETLKKNIIQLQEKALREQEEMLRRFTSDIHDLPCSIIPNLKQAIKRKDFEDCEKLVDELHSNLRQLINEYVVPDISLLGFGSTIYQFINGFRKVFKGKVIIDMLQEDINLSQKKALELFKVVKEWFCNIEKHSEASEVYLTLEKLDENYFLISISDNGKGFDVNDSRSHGYGLLNIKRRLQNINAKFEIKSEIGKGACLKIQVFSN